MPRKGRLWLLFASLMLLNQRGFAALPFPEDMSIRGAARVENGNLVIQMRMPLTAIRDAPWPLHPNTDHLDLPALRLMAVGLAKYWVVDRFPVWQHGRPLAKPEVISAQLVDVAGKEIPDSAEVNRTQTTLDVRFQYPIQDGGFEGLAIEPRVADLAVRVSTLLTAGSHDFSFSGDPGRFALDPGLGGAASQFFVRGTKALLGAADGLLFLFCLALPLRRYRSLTPAAVAFVAAVSMSFSASWLRIAPDGLWFRPLVALLAGALALLAALANIAGKPSPRRRALLALFAGVVFGFDFGFDFAGKAQFAGAHPAIAALGFNAGIAATALLVLALLVPVLRLLFRFARTERVELIVVSALAADTAWQWTSDRWTRFSRYPVSPPDLNASFFASALQWLAILTVFGGVVWFLNGWLAAREQS
jgi:hypothetical protein